MEVRFASHYGKLYLPADATAEAPCRVVMYLHGGFWKPQWNLHTLPTDALHRAFGKVAWWAVEYSRVDQAAPPASADGGGWPQTCVDVLRGANALGDGTLPEDVQRRLDTRRVFVCGHSAGGQLALWLAQYSRLPPARRSELAEAARPACSAADAACVAAGVHAGVCLVGVVGLAPIASLRAAALDGLSDFHDAAINFMWRAGPTADAAAPALAAACPTSLREQLPMLGGDAPPLSTLLIHGAEDTDVPASASVEFATRAWAVEGVHPVWLCIVPGADHYVVAGLGDLSNAPYQKPWATVCDALSAFVHGEEDALSAICCHAEDARSLCTMVPLHTCARHTVEAIVNGGTAREELEKKCTEQPDFEDAITRGLRRWCAWTGEGQPELVEWLDNRSGLREK
ncbi:hypothetical protein AB1Y20_004361 [Prymnesium parvum]|uniref:Uncharacterized protein n=1 Tax=Prymnesium parvum TaxID=97485 RepID=A0AB34IXE6_PRYPA